MIKRKYNMSDEDFKILTTVIIKSIPHKAGIQWKFEGAFYFATTVLTTIGYGHSTPATYGGKTFCMFYALAGIPLGLVMFQSIGERLNTFVAFSLKYCKKCLKMKTTEVSETNLILFVSIVSCIVMTTGAAAFSAWESWNYFDAFYYCFITLTTIGFGDYVALQKESALQSKPEYVIFSLVFILFGLSVVSAAINLLVLRFLTLNTEDERRDEAEAALTAAGRVRLEGDVITGNTDGSITSGMELDPKAILPDEQPDAASVCSCTCYGPSRRTSGGRKSSISSYYNQNSFDEEEKDDYELNTVEEYNYYNNYTSNSRNSFIHHDANEQDNYHTHRHSRRDKYQDKYEEDNDDESSSSKSNQVSRRRKKSSNWKYHLKQLKIFKNRDSDTSSSADHAYNHHPPESVLGPDKSTMIVTIKKNRTMQNDEDGEEELDEDGNSCRRTSI